MKMAESEESTT